jgi:hypothetical protein
MFITKQNQLGIFNRFLGSRAVAVLNHWFQSNRDYPYPDDERTDRLAREAGINSFSFLTNSFFEIGITQKQVKKWFANKRVRSQMCYKPLYRSRKVEQFFLNLFPSFSFSLVIHLQSVPFKIKFHQQYQHLHQLQQHKLVDLEQIIIILSIIIISQHQLHYQILVMYFQVLILLYLIPWRLQ